MSPFSEKHLLRLWENSYQLSGDAKMWLSRLLNDSLESYCKECENDRMLCVLSPQCTERILLKIRIQKGASKDAVPQFCYSQSVNNLKRFIKKLTTLYMPLDVWIYNEDFLGLFFPKYEKKFKKYYPNKVKTLHHDLEQSKILAVHINMWNPDYDLFRQIKNKGKLIREGTFIYDIYREYMIIWLDGNIFLLNFDSGLSQCNIKYDIIQDVSAFELVLHTYCAEHKLQCETKREDNHLLSIKIHSDFSNESIKKINGTNDKSEKKSSDNFDTEGNNNSLFAYYNDHPKEFSELCDLLEQYFEFIHIDLTETGQTLSCLYVFNTTNLCRHFKHPITYDVLNRLTNKFNLNLKKS